MAYSMARSGGRQAIFGEVADNLELRQGSRYDGNMSDSLLDTSLEGLPVFLTGIKGTGMSALAELLAKRGATVSGSDTSEKFYTDEVLKRFHIPYIEQFSADNLPEGTRLVVYSAAYNPNENPELVRARELGIPVLAYTDALGLLSRLSDSSGIAGVHGKTTTTALVGTILKSLRFPASVLAGSAVSTFGDSSTLVQGEKYFVAETCEYRRNFLAFHPTRIVITSVEPDHLDYFHDFEDILQAFVSYGELLPRGGELVYCADDGGAREVARRLLASRPDVHPVPYGESCEGAFQIVEIATEPGRSRFRLAGFSREFSVRIPGRHTVLNAAAAIALAVLLVEKERGAVTSEDLAAISTGVESFAGSRRRSEIVGEEHGILFMDDYGHHPTAIRTTLEGLRQFYPNRRLIVDFMSHTYSRTEALLEEFAGAFGAADLVILHKIYASAREKSGRVSGEDLFRRTAALHPNVRYFDEVMEAFDFCRGELKEGDLFITMGAGNNWVLVRALRDAFAGGNGFGARGGPA